MTLPAKPWHVAVRWRVMRGELVVFFARGGSDEEALSILRRNAAPTAGMTHEFHLVPRWMLA